MLESTSWADKSEGEDEGGEGGREGSGLLAHEGGLSPNTHELRRHHWDSHYHSDSHSHHHTRTVILELWERNLPAGGRSWGREEARPRPVESWRGSEGAPSGGEKVMVDLPKERMTNRNPIHANLRSQTLQCVGR